MSSDSNPADRGHVGRLAAPFAWFFRSPAAPGPEAQEVLLGQLLGPPVSAIMGSLCSGALLAVALHRTGNPIFWLLLACEAAAAFLRLSEARSRPRRMRRVGAASSICIDPAVLTSFLWCSLQGLSAFLLMSGDDPVLSVLSATLAMGLLGPLCARNYPAPRFTVALVMLVYLPFLGGAVLSAQPGLWLILLITPPFLLGAFQTIHTTHGALLARLGVEAEIGRIASRDALTGVLNRYGMDEALKSFAPGPGRMMALLMIDLDGFKQVNDAHGHGAGDLVLIEVTRRLRAHLREEDLLGRMGGDEFMIVLRTLPPAAIPCLAERLVRAVSEVPIRIDGGHEVRIGISLGYACLPEDAASSTELRLRADQALYDAKEAGKRAFCRSGRPPVSPLLAA